MLDKLRNLAIKKTFTERKTSQDVIKIENLKIHFPKASTNKLTDENLPQTYRTKPLVEVDGEILFGELAILRYLQKDGWDGVWVDTFHSRGDKKVFWSDMPPCGGKILPEKAATIYDRIVSENGGKSSGFFDVFAWKGNDFIFIEYKGEGDSSNQNEEKWIESALFSGIKPDQLFFVTY